MRVFLFGAACSGPIQAVLDLPKGQPAVATGWRAVQRADGLGAGLIQAEGARVEGQVVDLPPGTSMELWLNVLQCEPIELGTDLGPATAYGLPETTDPKDLKPWDLSLWLEDWAALTAKTIEGVLALTKSHGTDQLQRSLGQIMTRAASQVRAEATPTVVRARHGFTAKDVEIAEAAAPYLDFFQVNEHHLRFRRFDGGWSPVIKRAGFGGGDAVTVLPYDPSRDRVLVIEQFRYAPFLRGDRTPWVIEPIAGRIDPGETPEQAAEREALEEAGLTLGGLHKIGQYYPSPGGLVEYLISYVALCDLPDDADGFGGLDEEAEDIRVIVMPFDAFQNFVESSEAENGPLLMSAYWLFANRERLRALSQ